MCQYPCISVHKQQQQLEKRGSTQYQGSVLTESHAAKGHSRWLCHAGATSWSVGPEPLAQWVRDELIYRRPKTWKEAATAGARRAASHRRDGSLEGPGAWLRAWVWGSLAARAAAGEPHIVRVLVRRRLCPGLRLTSFSEKAIRSQKKACLYAPQKSKIPLSIPGIDPRIFWVRATALTVALTVLWKSSILLGTYFLKMFISVHICPYPCTCVFMRAFTIHILNQCVSDTYLSLYGFGSPARGQHRQIQAICNWHITCSYLFLSVSKICSGEYLFKSL